MQTTTARSMLNKVPEVTLYFWIIKVLCTTVGETASDYLSDNVGLGLTKTTFITAAILIAILVAQFRLRRYVPLVYWAGIVFISVVGTQITDNLSDNLGVSLVITTSVFSVVLALVFAAWYRSERTLSIHTIVTTRRESFYWLTVLFTFALGTAAGDLIAERLALGYVNALLLFVGAIALVAIAHFAFRLGPITAFWVAYILTRPLGASIGDELSQSRHDGGLGLGTTVTSFLFLATILVVVLFLTVTRKDVTEVRTRVLVVADETATPELLGALQDRARHGAVSFHLLVPDGYDGDALAAIADAVDDVPVESFVPSLRIGVEASVREGGFHEVIVSTLPHRRPHWLRLEHGLPVTTVPVEA